MTHLRLGTEVLDVGERAVTAVLAAEQGHLGPRRSVPRRASDCKAPATRVRRERKRLELAALDEELEEVRRGLELDVLDPPHEPLERAPRVDAEQEQLARPAQRRVADLDDAILGRPAARKPISIAFSTST